MRALFTCWFWVAALALCSAQPGDTTTRKSEQLVDVLSDVVTMKLDVDNDFDRFQLRGNTFNYDLQPNFGLSKSFSASYRFAAIWFSYLPRFLWTDDPLRKGKSRGFSYGFTLSKKHFFHSFSFARVRGFYLENTRDVIAGWNANRDDYIQFPDLRYWTLRGKTTYLFNPGFSFNAIHSQTERQLRSIATPVLSTSYRYYHIDNKSTNQVSSQRSANLEWVFMAGFYATAVHRKTWYATIGCEGGAGVYHTFLLTRLPGENVNSNFGRGLIRGSIHGALGYNSGRFAAGGEFMADRTFTKQTANVEMRLTRVVFQIFVAYRLQAPTPVKRAFDSVAARFR